MFHRLGRREITVAAVLTTLALGTGISIGPVVRARVAHEAQRRRLDVRIGAVHLGWFMIRLTDVDAQPNGLTSIHLHAAETDVSLGLFLRPIGVEVSGAQVTLSG